MSMGEDPRDESKGEEMEVKMEEAREDRSEGEERLRPGSPSSTLNTSSSFEHALAPLAGPSGGVRVNVQSIVFHRELGGGIYGQAGVGGCVYRGPRRWMVPGTPGGALAARTGLAAYSGVDVSKMWHGFLEGDSLLRSEKRYCPMAPMPTSTIAIDVSPEGKYFASTHGKPDHSVRIIDCETLQCVRKLEGHNRTPWVVCFHPTDSNIVASGSLDQTVRIWDIASGRAICSWPAQRAITSISFDAQGKILAIATGRKGYLWDWMWRDEQGRRRQPQKVLRTRRSLRAIQFYPLSCAIPRGSVSDAGGEDAGRASGRPRIRREALLTAEVEDEIVGEGGWQNGRGAEVGGAHAGMPGHSTPHMFGQRHHRLIREAGGLTGGGLGRSYTGRAVDAMVRRPEYDPVDLGELRAQGNAAALRQASSLTQRSPAPTVDERPNSVRLRLWDYDPLNPMEVLDVGERRASDQGPQAASTGQNADDEEVSAAAAAAPGPGGARRGAREGGAREGKHPIFTLGNVVLCSETGVHMSRCGKYLAACIAWPGQVGGDLRYELQVFSLLASNFGQVIASRPVLCANCLTSVQFSPCSEHILIAYGRQNERLKALAGPEDDQADHLILEIYRLSDMTLVRRVLSSDDEVNVAAFHPHAGGGLVYGTKEGKVCRLAYDRSLEPTREHPVIQGDVRPWHSLSDLIATTDVSLNNVSLCDS